MPFIVGESDPARIVRDDFKSLYLEPESWSEVRSQSRVWKGYLELLYPGLGFDLDSLVRAINVAGLKVAIEVQGSNPTRPEGCAVGGGRWQAAQELPLLRRWRDADGGRGRIDYFTTDHAIARTIEASLTGQCNLSPSAAAHELAGYYRAIQDEFPEAEFGLIESLGYWSIQGPDGTQYVTVRSDLPTLRLADILELVAIESRMFGIRLGHYDIDYGADGVEYDGQRHPTSAFAVAGHDYGRILGAEQIARSNGLVAGVIFNAYDKTSPPSSTVSMPSAEQRLTFSRSARDRTLWFWDEYRHVGGRSSKLVFQTWQPYPDRTGPETAEATVTNLARELVRRATACLAGESGASAPTRCCDASTPCDARQVGSGFECGSIDGGPYGWREGTCSLTTPCSSRRVCAGKTQSCGQLWSPNHGTSPYQWWTFGAPDSYCDQPNEICRSTYRGGDCAGTCRGIAPTTWSQGPCRP
jgi:hypothetical protein